MIGLLGVIRSRRGRGRSSGTSRGVSESSLEGHDADVYEFNDTEEEETVVAAHAPAHALPDVVESKTPLHDDNIVTTHSQQVIESTSINHHLLYSIQLVLFCHFK